MKARAIFGTLLATLIWLIAGPVQSAQCPPLPKAPSPKVIAELKASAKDRGFLWRISKNGHVSWLYGTLHVGKLAWALPGPRVVDALHRSDVIAMELDFSNPATMQRLQELSRQDARRVPDALKPRFRKLLDSVCLPETLADSVNPAILLETIEIAGARSEGLEAGYGVELILTEYAHRTGKPIVALETPESQMALLLGAANEQSDGELEDELEQIEQGKANSVMQRLALDWAHSDIKDLQRYGNWCDCMSSKAERAEIKRVVDDRNGPMAIAIAALHEQGKSVFVAVGSLHMIGSSGIPAQLKRMGFKVAPISFH